MVCVVEVTGFSRDTWWVSREGGVVVTGGALGKDRGTTMDKVLQYATLGCRTSEKSAVDSEASYDNLNECRKVPYCLGKNTTDLPDVNRSGDDFP